MFAGDADGLELISCELFPLPPRIPDPAEGGNAALPVPGKLVGAVPAAAVGGVTATFLASEATLCEIPSSPVGFSVEVVEQN